MYSVMYFVACELGEGPVPGGICEDCSYGFYKDVVDDKPCKKCHDDHHTTISEGSKSASDCGKKHKINIIHSPKMFLLAS